MHDDVDDATRDPEAEIEARLRLLGAVILALGIVAISLSGEPLGLTFRGFCSPSALRELQVGCGVMLAPGALVVWRPSARRVTLWTCWSLPFVLVGLVGLVQAASQAMFEARFMNVWSLWPAWGTCALAGAIMLGIVVVLPRISASRGPRVASPPVARVVCR
ncbi:MAG TPA: hypothetical protein VH165_18225 [Kofleriaceae bacterium]|nr:hypothetical protein [Kofleriaceae bacterium]